MLGWAIPLGVVAVLWTVNEFLHGRLKPVVSGVLSLAIFGLCVVASFVSGWWAGPVALVATFALVNLVRAPALWLAQRLTGGYANLGSNHQPPDLARLAAMLGTPEMDREWERREERDEALVQHALGDARVRELLDRLGLEERDVRAFLVPMGVPLDMIDEPFRRRAVSNASILAYYFAHSTPQENELGYQRIIDGDTSLVLGNWVRYAPDKSAPPR